MFYPFRDTIFSNFGSLMLLNVALCANVYIWSHTNLWIELVKAPSSDLVLTPFKAGVKSLSATLHDEIFYWVFCFLNRAFR
jgi:hypothetical protein